MKNLKSIAYLVGSLMVVACSAGDSSAGAPSDPVSTVAPLKLAAAQAVADAITLRDQLQAESHGDASMVAPGHRLVKIARIQQRAVDEMEALMEQAIADHNGAGTVAVKNTGGTGGNTGNTDGTGADKGTGDGGEVGTTDPDLDNMDDDLNNMDDDLNGLDDDLNPIDDTDGGTDVPDSGMDEDAGPDDPTPTPTPTPSMGGADAGTDPCKCGNTPSGNGGKPTGGKPGGKPAGGKGGGKPSGGGAGGGKPAAAGQSGAALQKLLEKLIKLLEKGATSPGQAKAKAPKASSPAAAVQADLTQLYKLLNDPLFKKWQKFGGKP